MTTSATTTATTTTTTEILAATTTTTAAATTSTTATASSASAATTATAASTAATAGSSELILYRKWHSGKERVHHRQKLGPASEAPMSVETKSASSPQLRGDGGAAEAHCACSSREKVRVCACVGE